MCSDWLAPTRGHAGGGPSTSHVWCSGGISIPNNSPLMNQENVPFSKIFIDPLQKRSGQCFPTLRSFVCRKLRHLSGGGSWSSQPGGAGRNVYSVNTVLMHHFTGRCCWMEWLERHRCSLHSLTHTHTHAESWLLLLFQTSPSKINEGTSATLSLMSWLHS